MVALAAAATILSSALARQPLLVEPAVAGTVICFLALACLLFVISGVLRLAKWRLVQDRHSALVGTALLVMGALCLPSAALAHVVPTDDAALVGSAARSVATVFAVSLVLAALQTRGTREPRPFRLLPLAFVAVSGAFTATLLLEGLVAELVTQAHPLVALGAVRAVLWFTLAVIAARRARDLDWARRSAPLLLGMGLVECLRTVDQRQVDAWTLGSLLLCCALAALSARSALRDLDRAVADDRSQRRSLSEQLSVIASEADDALAWRDQLRHDTRNACAGLRAAMQVLETYADPAAPPAAGDLRRAAAAEIGHLEHLITRTGEEPLVQFDVRAVVGLVSREATRAGTPVDVAGDVAQAIGRSGDLEAVLRQLVANTRCHAPGASVRMHVEQHADRVVVTCLDDGPGLPPGDPEILFARGVRGPGSQGSGLGLHEARRLVRAQGGDLHPVPTRAGAGFAVTLPAAVPTLPRLVVPRQRTVDEAC